MAEKTISALVEGGKATAGPPLGPALGPIGINIGEVIAEINKRTADFKGTTVPVKVIIDTSTKEFKIEVGTPPVSALIKKELSLKKGAQKSKEEKVGDLAIDQAIKIARSKRDVLHAKTMQAAVKEIVGACLSIGVTVEGKDPREVQKEIDAGVYDEKIEGKVKLREVSKDEIEKKKAELAAEAEEKRKEEEAEKAKEEAEKPAEEKEEEPEEKEGEEKAEEKEGKPEEKKKESKGKK